MDGKKVVTSKRINIKNKKMAAQALAKKSSKEPSTKANNQKKVAPKKVKEVVNDRLDSLTALNEELKKDQPLLEQIQKEPQELPKAKKETKSKKETTTKKTTKKTTTKTTKKTTPKKTTEKKTKLEIPKEWQEINVKKQKTVEKEKGLNKKIKRSIFEELDEVEYKEKKKKEKEQFKKSVIILLSIVLVSVIAVFLLFKYNDHVRSRFATYDKFNIGDIVRLSDGSFWYVIDDSGEKEETVKLVYEYVIDVNGDGQITSEDELVYNTENKSEFDEENENSVAYYLVNEYKPKLEEKIGAKIKEVRLLTSKEFVTIRDTLEFGYEWYTGNWLANQYLKDWWIISSQNNKVYVITTTGAYILYSPSTVKYVRPAIEIKKEHITLYKAQQPKVDGLYQKVEEFGNLGNKD